MYEEMENLLKIGKETSHHLSLRSMPEIVAVGRWYR